MRKRKSEQEMFALIEDWGKSGLDQGTYCRTHQITLSSFTYWRGKYLKVHSDQPVFRELLPINETSSVEVVYPNGVSVRLSKGFSMQMISALICLC